MENLYKPQLAKIANIEELSPTAKIFTLKLATKFKKDDDVHLLYGAVAPKDLVFKKEYPRWQKSEIDLCVTIDKPSTDWQGEIGFVSGLCNKIEVDPRRTPG